MNRFKKLKSIALVMLLFSFIAASSLSSCREQKKKESTEQAGEHPEGEEHPTEEGTAKDEHPEGEEHPAKDGDEHPEGEEHPAKDSVSG
ncbi:hypothetical protein [Maribacter sp. HTCC2170]|uniref:hypothetical protein n=1 Tax=Maribacter sp. (strain HTCC2170 / KCCM 42371) TaxID=313603 RepID=UPI00006AFD52|nr:hypothetical protein [Maribacter sp. HTCC2170]EAR01380.1 hypothetical protein FB2170_11686 [Maribacter sp. HTCC2170]